MALIKCPECGKEYSENAKRCPNCGSPSEKTVGRQNIIWDVVIALFFLIPFFTRYYLFWVAGIILMWVKKTPERKASRIIATIFFGSVLLAFIVSGFTNY